MASDPYPTSDLIKVVVSRVFAADLLADVVRPVAERTVHRMTVGEADCGSWQVQAVATRRTDAGYDDITATFQRVLV